MNDNQIQVPANVIQEAPTKLVKGAKSLFFTVLILLTATSLTSAQDKTDSIKVIYESKSNSPMDSLPEYYVDSVLLKTGGFIDMINPIAIEKIKVDKKGKGKIYITLKKDVPYNFVSLQSLGKKYLKNTEAAGVLYTVDGKLIIDPESIINEKDILSVSIASDLVLSSLSREKVTIFKILTKSKLNIDNANRTFIRGIGLKAPKNDYDSN